MPPISLNSKRHVPAYKPPARILYIEDHSDTLELVSFVLRENGFEVVTVADPEEAIQLAQTEPFSIYILNNWHTSSALRFRDPDSVLFGRGLRTRQTEGF